MRALLVFAACLLIWMEPAGAASGPELPETGSIQETTSSDAHVIHIAQRNAQPRRRNYRTRQDVALGRVFDPLTRTWVDPVTTRDRRDIARYRRALVPLVTEVPAGTIIIDPDSHYLYLTLPNDEAIRYGVGLGREGFGWSGTVEIGRKAEWPVWTPPADMVKREPWLAEYANGMPGGEDNPLGARALYLYENGQDTIYRIHGTNQPWSIGQNVSSGCIRMINDDIVDLYDRVGAGTTVIVLAPIGPVLGRAGK